MGLSVSLQAFPFPYDPERFRVIWLAFKSEAQDPVLCTVPREVFMSSKILKDIFGPQIISEFDEPMITKEMLVWKLAQLYNGTFEEKIAFIFDMYAIINNEIPVEGPEDYLMTYAHQKDYVKLIQYGLDRNENIPAALRHCSLFPEGSDTKVSQVEFLGWLIRNKNARKYLVRMLPFKEPGKSLDEQQSPRSPNTHGAAFHYMKRQSTSSSIDLVGGEDSSDDDEDGDPIGIATSDIMDMAILEKSRRSSWAGEKEDGNDADINGIGRTCMTPHMKHTNQEERMERFANEVRATASPDTPNSFAYDTPASSPSAPFHNNGKHNPKGLQKVGKKFSRVKLKKLGNSFRPSYGNSHTDSKGIHQLRSAKGSDEYSLELSPPSPSPYTSRCSRYLCGYLNKLSDGKWSKRTWHRRWFVLDQKTGILYYYKADPKIIAPKASNDIDNIPENQPMEVSEFQRDLEDDDSPCSLAQDQTVQSHPSLRGYIDLNHSDTSLLFEKQYAQNAPTRFFFQVSTLGIGEVERKRGTQLKLCAADMKEFTRWTGSLSIAINRKHTTPCSIPKDMMHYCPQLPVTPATPTAAFKGSPERRDTVDTFSMPKSSYSLHLSVSGYWPCFCVYIASVFILTFVMHDIAALCFQPFQKFTCWMWCFVLSSILSAGLLHRNLVGTSHEQDRPQNDQRNPTTENSLLKENDNSKVEDSLPNSLSLLFEMKSTINVSLDQKNDLHSYSTAKGEDFNIRGSTYLRDRLKQPSESSILEFLGMDVVETPRKLSNIGRQICRTKEFDNVKKLFILNGQMPNFSPANPLWGESKNDGPGFNFVCYWRIPDDVLLELEKDEVNIAAPEIRLFKRFISRDPEILDRFKLIAVVRNIEECKLAGAAKHVLNNNNGTPVLTRPQHALYVEKDYIEMDIDVYTFSYFARKSIYLLLGQLSKFVMDVGFVLQGASETELPERILGCMRCVRIDVGKAKNVSQLAKEMEKRKVEEEKKLHDSTIAQ